MGQIETKRFWVVREPGIETFPDVPLKEAPLRELLDFSVAVIDKPRGPTSHDVVETVQRILHVRKAGHGGTLDPNASGVLPVLLSAATPLSSLVLKGGKEYIAQAIFHGEVTREDLAKTAAEFTGTIEQLPPVRSRVKRELRERDIYEIEILSLEKRNASIRISCQAGTYIRKLVHDMGLKLETGAHMAGLVRIRAGMFGIENSATPGELDEAFGAALAGDESRLRGYVLPAEKMAAVLPRMVIDAGAVKAILNGSPLRVPGVLKFEAPFEEGDEVALLDPSGSLLALGTAGMPSSRLAESEKGTAAALKRVLRKV